MSDSDLEKLYKESLELALEGSRFIDSMHDDILRFMGCLVRPLNRVFLTAGQAEAVESIRGELRDWELAVEWVAPDYLAIAGSRPDPGDYRLAVIYYPVGRGYGRSYDLSLVKLPLYELRVVRNNLHRVLLCIEKMLPAKDYGIFSQALENLKEFGRMAVEDKTPEHS